MAHYHLFAVYSYGARRKQVSLPGTGLLEFPPMTAPSTPQTIPDVTEDISTGAGTGFESRVVVFNCDCHTYQQVIDLFCSFIPGMTATKAFELAYRIDHEGEAVVYSGATAQAEEIAAKLAGGGLKVVVQ